MQIDKDAIQTAIIEKVSEQILEEWDFRSEARAIVLRKVDAAFDACVQEQIAKSIKAVVDEGFDREYFRIDQFGKTVGQPTSIRAEMSVLVSDYWATKVGRDGKPKGDTYGDKFTRAEWLMMQVCGESFSKDLKQEAVNIAAGLKDGLRAQLRASMDAMLNDLFKVKSEQDAKEKLY